jgi:hypothetical protein
VKNGTLLAVAGVSLLVATRSRAQCTPGGPPNPAPAAGALTGIVMDSGHDPLEGASVFIRNPKRQARTSASGYFRLDSLAAGTYEVTVRMIGHEIAMQSYTVSDSGGVARFCLVSEPRALAPIITAVPRGGLSGVVGDSAYQMVSGAEVRAVTGGAHALTDSAGGFFLDLKPGTYPITVKKEGYGIQLLSVTIPRDSGRQIAVWLTSPPKNARRIAAAIEDSMKFRMTFLYRAAHFKLLSSEELMRNPADILTTVQGATVTAVSSKCEAIVDGGPYQVPLYTIDKSEIAAMEVYVKRESSRGPTSINPGGTAGGSGGSDECKVKVYVWMKP